MLESMKDSEKTTEPKDCSPGPPCISRMSRTVMEAWPGIEQDLNSNRKFLKKQVLRDLCLTKSQIGLNLDNAWLEVRNWNYDQFTQN